MFGAQATLTLPLTAAATLAADLGAALPQPFEATVPYTDSTGRDRYRAQIRAELIERGLWHDEPAPELTTMLRTVLSAPSAIIGIGRTRDGVLASRTCRQSAVAVCATQRGSDLVLTAVDDHADLAATTLATLPATPPATGAPAYVPASSAGPVDAAADDDEDSGFQSVADTSGVRRTRGLDRNDDRTRVAELFANPILGAGAFTAAAPSAPRDPVLWYDVDEPDSGPVRYCATVGPGRHGGRWITYRPGDRETMTTALRTLLEISG